MNRQRLTGRAIGISGAVPEPEVLEAHGVTEADVHTVVRRVAQRVFLEGGEIVHGCHPTFTRIIEDGARRWLRGETNRKIVHMYNSLRFFNPKLYPYAESLVDFNRHHSDYAEVFTLGGFDQDRDTALRMMREAMIGRVDALVCVGGKLHVGDGNKSGVVEEIEFALGLAKRPQVPVYLVGHCGGMTREIMAGTRAPELKKRIEAHAGADVNEKLTRTQDVWEAAELVIEGMARYFQGNAKP